MAQNVLTDAGFNRPTLPQLVQRIGDRLEAAVGPINREADSNTGQFIGSVAEEITIAYETTEAVWLSRFIESASGLALDAIGEWMGGIQRRSRTQTQVNAVVYGDEGIPVPAGSLASYQNNNFTLENDVTITRGSLVDGAFSVDSTAPASFTVRANGVDLTYTKAAGDTTSTIATKLAAVINNTSEFYVASANGSSVSIRAANNVQGYAVSLSTGLTWTKIGSPAIFRAVEFGPIQVPIGALNNAVSAIPGWTSVTNLVIGSAGNDRESDADYRQRLNNTLGNTDGRATVDSIKAALLNDVEGVTLAEVLENDTMTPSSTMEPKSILCIVDGGLEQEIAQKIWDYKGGGIFTNGDILVTAYDTSGKPHGVRFSRSGQVTVYIRVVVNALDNEEETPADIVARIQQGVRNYFSTLSLGDDVIIQRIYGYIYANTTGIARMTITGSTNGTTFNANDIAVGETASAKLQTVEVSGV